MDKITGARVAAEATKAGDAQNAATKQVQAQRQKLAAERQKRLNENLLQVRKLQMEMKYDEAMQVLDQILFEDPNNAAALTTEGQRRRRGPAPPLRASAAAASAAALAPKAIARKAPSPAAAR